MIWLPELGIGYYPVKETPYDQAYFDKYARYAQTELGVLLNSFRLRHVSRFYPGDKLIDIGIGCGQFVEARNESGRKTFGYDVNKVGIDWLTKRELFWDPYFQDMPEAITCWDVLEHVAHPEKLLNRVKQFVFLSIPIFRDVNHIMHSRHFRKDEHFWYFTEQGLIKLMRQHGFAVLHICEDETRLGREDIMSFAFRRV